MVVSGCSGCLGDAGEVSIAIDIIMALVVFICWITSVFNEQDYVYKVVNETFFSYLLTDNN